MSGQQHLTLTVGVWMVGQRVNMQRPYLIPDGNHTKKVQTRSTLDVYVFALIKGYTKVNLQVHLNKLKSIWKLYLF